MGDFFDDLFRSTNVDYRQSRELDDLREEVANASLDYASRRDFLAMARQFEQVQLMNRALVDILLKKGLVTKDELNVVIQQIDLLDGVEDGRISEQLHRDAPTCGTCGRFVNPRRKECVYCGAEVRTAARSKPPVRKVTCNVCNTEVPERSTYYSEQGVVCSGCFTG